MESQFDGENPGWCSASICESEAHIDDDYVSCDWLHRKIVWEIYSFKNPSAFSADQGIGAGFGGFGIVSGCGGKTFKVSSMFPHEDGLHPNLPQGAPKNNGLNDQSKKLERPNDGEPFCKFDDLPLYFCILATLYCVGIGQVGAWLVGSRNRHFVGSLVILVGLLGALSLLTALLFCAPCFGVP